MTKPISILYYDGQYNIAYPAQLYPHPDGVLVHYQQQKRLYLFKDMEYLAGIGDILPAIDLPNDARIEFLDHNIPDWLILKHKKMLHHVNIIEKSWRWIFVSFIGMLAVIYSVFKWGIPFLAYSIAMNLPDSTLNKIGYQAQEAIMHYTQPSKLTPLQQQRIIKLYQKLHYDAPANLIFRQGGQSVGANALAIPNNTIILTDELITLTQHDYELLAVLAHEQGHLTHKHSLQQSLRGIGAGLFYVMITGDLSDLATTLPAMIVSAQYSQQFEFDADQHAINELKRLNISPQYLADFLTRLDQYAGHEQEDSKIDQLLSSHPATVERIQKVQDQLP